MVSVSHKEKTITSKLNTSWTRIISFPFISLFNVLWKLILQHERRQRFIGDLNI